MAPYAVSLALAVFAVLFVLFLKREVENAPEHVEPDIDAIIAKIEAEISSAKGDVASAKQPPRLKRLAA